MRVLALETSDKTGSVAALDDDRLIVELDLPPQQRSAQSLAPALRSLCSEVGWKITDVELIAVTAGPGSFTGLRVGVTTAKMLAYVSGAALAGVSTLQTVAMQLADESAQADIVLDAQRQELFTQRFDLSSAGRKPIDDVSILPQAAWLERLGPEILVAGPGLKKLKSGLLSNVQVAPEELWTPRASSVGRLGFQLFQQGHRDDMWALTPHYYRRSAAEEKLDEKARS